MKSKESYGPVKENVQPVYADGRHIANRAITWVPVAGGKGTTRTKRYELDVPLKTLRDWCEAERVAARQRLKSGGAAPSELPAVGVGFLAKADEYLEAVQTMPQYEGRAYHIRLWAALFGEREPESITSVEIRTQRERWLTVGPKKMQQRGRDGTMAWVEKAIPLSGQEVNLRLRALQNFFTVMYPGRPNPVREVPECEGAALKPRGQTFDLVREILRFMPDVTTPKKGELAEDGSLNRARFAVMAYTGLEAKQVGRLKEDHVTWSVPCYVMPRRQKGRAIGARQRPRMYPPKPERLIAAAVPALHRFFELGANKPFSRSSLRRSVRAAMAAANRDRATRGVELIDMTLTVKDLTRHTFATELLRHSTDPKALHTVKDLLGHSDIRQTEVYVQAALQESTNATIAALDQHLSPQRPSMRLGHSAPPARQKGFRKVQKGFAPKSVQFRSDTTDTIRQKPQ